VRTHPQETGEGSVDLGHLRFVHNYLTAEAVGEPETDGPHLRARYRVTRRALPGMPRDTVTLEFAPELHGLGFSTVTVRFPEMDFCYRVWVLPTPIDGELVDYRIAFTMQEPSRPDALHTLLRHIPRSLASMLIEELSFRALTDDVELDFPIWENKAYVQRPALLAGDGPIGLYRRWAKQFYAKSTVGEAHVVD
jgi:hypothetical protein